jgi:hypothetical protein
MTATALMSLVNCFLAVPLAERLGTPRWPALGSLAVTAGSAVFFWVLYVRAYVDYRVATALRPPASAGPDVTEVGSAG